jgi:hypothetical protein
MVGKCIDFDNKHNKMVFEINFDLFKIKSASHNSDDQTAFSGLTAHH